MIQKWRVGQHAVQCTCITIFNIFSKVFRTLVILLNVKDCHDVITCSVQCSASGIFSKTMYNHIFIVKAITSISWRIVLLLSKKFSQQSAYDNFYLGQIRWTIFEPCEDPKLEEEGLCIWKWCTGWIDHWSQLHAYMTFPPFMTSPKIVNEHIFGNVWALCCPGHKLFHCLSTQDIQGHGYLCSWRRVYLQRDNNIFLSRCIKNCWHTVAKNQAWIWMYWKKELIIQ